jgi:hypothetical protein
VTAAVVPPTATSYCFPPGTVWLSQAASYATTLVATNGCGLSSSTTTDGFLFDTTAPKVQRVADGDPGLCGSQDIATQAYAYFAGHWSLAEDVLSGIASLTAAFVLCNGPGVVLARSSTLPPNATVYTVSSGFAASVPPGSRVCLSVTPVDRAGNTATFTSNGSMYDTSATVGPRCRWVSWPATYALCGRRQWV